MKTRISLFLVMMLAAACGGGGPAPSLVASPPPGQTAAPAEATPVVIAPGESIEGEQISAAFDALQALDSWTFTGKYWTKGFDEGFEQSVRGTERRSPEVAIDAYHKQPASGEEFRYIRIGDDIWTDAGTGEFFHSDAPDSENLIDQYEPNYAAALVDDAAGAGTLEFEPVGVETVNGVAAMHYTLSENDRENVVQLLDIEPSLWAGDVWIANDGYLVALAWGPQSKETAQSLMGFRYDVTSTKCACPIEAPE